MQRMELRMPNKKGVFITLEGGEGCGKSTQIKMLDAYLKEQGIPHHITREPGGSPAAEEIRKIILSGSVDKWDSVSETLLFSAARRSHLTEVIWPNLEKGVWVISDRYADSTMAYQGYGRNDHLLSRADIETLYRITAGDFKPDLTFILDIEPQKGLERAQKRANLDRMEEQKLAFHENLRQAFLDIASREPMRCVIINADQTPELVHKDILDVLKERFHVC